MLDLHGVACHEPDFRQTVVRWHTEHPEAVQLDLDLDAVPSAVRLALFPAPAGFLFNPPRCGSTLLANILGAPAEHLMIKQSRTVNVLLRETLLGPDEAGRAAAETLIAHLLPLYANCDVSVRRRLFFKPSSWAINLVQPLRRLFPNTPGIFLYRDPHDAVASMLASPPVHPPYVFPSTVPPEIRNRFFPSLATAPTIASAVSYYAHIWRSAVEAALAAPAGSLQFVEYAALVADPQRVVAAIFDQCSIPHEPAAILAACSVLHTYSKDRDGRAVFDPSGAHHRPPLDRSQRAEVVAVVGDLPAQLSRYGPG